MPFPGCDAPVLPHHETLATLQKVVPFPAQDWSAAADRADTVWSETVPSALIELCQHPLADQDRDGEDPLSIGCCDRQRNGRAAEGDERVDVQVVAGQPDYRWNQLGQVRRPSSEVCR
jgi:hypothetical protein